MLYRYGRVMSALALTALAATACGSGSTRAEPATPQAPASHSPKQLQQALLNPDDLPGEYRPITEPTSAPVTRLTTQKYLKKLRKSKISKPGCTNFYMRALGSATLLEKLRNETAAIVSLAGKDRIVSEALVSVPPDMKLTILRQGFRPDCAEFTMTLPSGQKLQISVQRLDVTQLGNRTTSYRIVRTVDDRKLYLVNQVVRLEGAMLNVGIRGPEPIDTASLEKVAKTAYLKARGRLR